MKRRNEERTRLESLFEKRDWPRLQTYVAENFAESPEESLILKQLMTLELLQNFSEKLNDRDYSNALRIVDDLDDADFLVHATAEGLRVTVRESFEVHLAEESEPWRTAWQNFDVDVALRNMDEQLAKENDDYPKLKEALKECLSNMLGTLSLKLEPDLRKDLPGERPKVVISGEPEVQTP